MYTTYQTEGPTPQRATLERRTFDDLSLPRIDPQLEAIKEAGKRGIVVAVVGVAITALVFLTDITPLLQTGIELLGLEVDFGKGELSFFYALALVFATMMGSFAFCLPRVQEQVATYVEKFDTIVTIARQITLADGIGDNERRKAASDILWQAKALRKNTRKKLVGAAIGAILGGCVPWLLVLSLTNIMQYGVTLVVMVLSIVVLKLILVQRIITT